MERDRTDAGSAGRSDVIDSFDQIARHATGGGDHNSHYHLYLLRHLPPHRGAALDVGSGLGAFSRLLADRFDRVEAIDFSPEMVARASAHPISQPNLHYTCADFLVHAYPPASFDCVVSIAALHHLPLPQALARMADVLKPGGRLLVLDLYQVATAGDLLISAAGIAASVAARAARPMRQSEALRAAWEEHKPLDHYLTISEIKSACSALLPGARIRRHIYFRYSLICWTLN
jgi:ubiquinone/menaquinone biosynthesis C-methylase UbiE